MADLLNMMKQAKEIMRNAETAKTEMAGRHVVGSAGAGLVTATINGLGALVGINIDKSVINPDDPEMLADLIVAAVADGQNKLEPLRNEIMQKLTGGMDLGSIENNLKGML